MRRNFFDDQALIAGGLSGAAATVAWVKYDI